VRRVGEVARLMVDAGLIVIVALVSPFRADRARAARLLPEDRFLEIFIDTPAEVCRQRDAKGLYALADKGQVANMTGRDQALRGPERSRPGCAHVRNVSGTSRRPSRGTGPGTWLGKKCCTKATPERPGKSVRLRSIFWSIAHVIWYACIWRHEPRGYRQ